MISIPAVARIAEHRAAAGLAAGPAGGDGIAVRGAGAGVDRLRVVNDAVIVEVIRPAVELLPAGDMLAGQEIHPVGRALDRQPAGVLRGPDVDRGRSSACGRARSRRSPPRPQPAPAGRSAPTPVRLPAERPGPCPQNGIYACFSPLRCFFAVENDRKEQPFP